MENYLYPFFWQHGEDHDVLKKYMEKISGCGMKGVCVDCLLYTSMIRQMYGHGITALGINEGQISEELMQYCEENCLLYTSRCV